MRRRPLLVAASIAGALLGCTDAVLYDPVDVPSEPDKIALRGQVCTDNPAERSFPLRVVFVVDTSPLMPFDAGDTVGPPLLEQARVQAVRDAVGQLRAPDAKFAIVRYGGDSVVAPDGGFSSNTADVNEAAGALSVPLNCSTDGCRRLGQALSLADSLITGDLLSTPRGPRSRTKYVIVVMQAGPTDDALLTLTPDCPDVGCVLAGRVADLRRRVLENGGADFQLHSYDITPISDDPLVFLPAQAELERMAFAGTGAYRPLCERDDTGVELGAGATSRCRPDLVTLLGLEINSARNLFLQKSFVVANLSAIATNDGGAIPDSDADGLSDEEEAQTGTDPSKRDTDADGVGDRIELLLSTVGLDPVVFDDPPTCEPIDPSVRPTLDTDGDGLLDCEEALLRLDATLFDTDADGAPDLLEVLSGTNFLEDDGLTDSDFDGTPNNVELRAHTDPRSADARARNELGYLYREVDLGIRELLFATQPRDLTGITVEDIGIGSSLGNGELAYTLTGAGGRVLAWRDPLEANFGPGVEIDGDGVYTLRAECPDQDPCERTLTVTVTTALLLPWPGNELLRVAAAERQCTDFRVRNVTLVETAEADGRPAGYNDVRIYFGQVPSDVPRAFGIFRVAQLPFSYFADPPRKEPNVAELLVDDFRFVLFE